MKKLLILAGSFMALSLMSSCTAESIEENESTLMTDTTLPPPLPPDHGGSDRDKDKDKK